MNILLIGNYAPDQQRSMQRFLAMLEAGLRGKGLNVTVMSPPVVFGKLALNNRILKKWLGYVDKLLVFPRTLRRCPVSHDLVHICDHSNAMYATVLSRTEARGIPVVVTCHDLIAVRGASGAFPEIRVRWSGKKLQSLVRIGLTKATRVVCISRATAADLGRLLEVDEGRFPIVNLGIQESFRNPALPPRQTPAPYFINVGDGSWYKNRAFVIAVFAQLKCSISDLVLKIVGAPITATEQRLLVEYRLQDSVFWLSGLSDDELCAEYRGAQALFFPSLIEGFGWPIIEAQAAGCPVITSDREPMREISGTAALLIDPSDVQAASEAILAAYQRRNAGSTSRSGLRKLPSIYS
jgi:glycosyltransferase involved in cell wall biosynthesis